MKINKINKYNKPCYAAGVATALVTATITGCGTATASDDPELSGDVQVYDPGTEVQLDGEVATPDGGDYGGEIELDGAVAMPLDKEDNGQEGIFGKGDTEEIEVILDGDVAICDPTDEDEVILDGEVEFCDPDTTEEP
ncbi:MAG: hypothetical protein K5871_09135 [Lachnospiraceae bacterium]|nr:hypothetical protein [Lachnospiraceae bacterium]